MICLQVCIYKAPEDVQTWQARAGGVLIISYQTLAIMHKATIAPASKAASDAKVRILTVQVVALYTGVTTCCVCTHPNYSRVSTYGHAASIRCVPTAQNNVRLSCKPNVAQA